MFTINQNLIDDFADKINEKEKKSNKLTSLSSLSYATDDLYPSALIVKDYLDTKEDTSNKVTSISSSSTDDEYPSALCVYDAIDNETSRISNIEDTINDLGVMAFNDTIDAVAGSSDIIDILERDGYSLFSGDYDDLDNKPSIPSASSDLSDGSDLVKKSSTVGLLKNDGSVMSSGTGSSNWAVGNHTHTTTDITNLSIPNASSTTPSADTENGSVGTGTTWARSNHAHPKSSLYAEATHTHTQSQITDFPTIPDVSGKENISNKTSSWNPTTNNTRYPTEKLVKDSLDLKANSADLSTVATTGDYEDLLNLPEEICITDFYYDATSDELVLNTCTNNDISTITSKEDKSNKVTSWSATPTHSHYPSEKLVKDYIDDMIGDIIEYIEG